jgi:hypothetical protein
MDRAELADILRRSWRSAMIGYSVFRMAKRIRMTELRQTMDSLKKRYAIR